MTLIFFFIHTLNIFYSLHTIFIIFLLTQLLFLPQAMQNYAKKVK